MELKLRKYTESLGARKQRFAGLVYLTTAAAFITMISALDVAACTIEYVVQPGDSYYSIAEKQYGDSKWSSLISRSNDVSDNEMSISPGSSFIIPCSVAETEQGPDPLESRGSEIRFLIGGGNAPFTDENLPNKGLVTELIVAALARSPEPVSYSITWDDNWTERFGPTPGDSTFDMGFPVFRPDCAAVPQHELCTRFNFSDPLIQLPIMLFVKEDSQFQFDSETDISEKTLCGPKGYPNLELNSLSRSAYSDFTSRLIIEEKVEDCFEKVASGSVDAVAVDLFSGAHAIVAMKLQYKVVPLKRPLSTESLHAVASKQQPQSEAFLDRINLGLERIRVDGLYQEIVSRHVESILPKEATDGPLSLGSVPATDPGDAKVTVAQKSRFDSLSEYIETDHLVALPPEEPLATKPEITAEGALAPDVPQNVIVVSSLRPIARPTRLRVIAQSVQVPTEVIALVGETRQVSETRAPEGPIAALASFIKPSTSRPARVPSASPQRKRGNTVVVGVFDLGNEKWGLFKLPNGEIRELRPGQGVAGMVLESVSGSTVRVQSKDGLKTLRTGDLIETAQR